MRFSATTAIHPNSRSKKHLTGIFAGVQAIDRYWTRHSLLAERIHAARQKPMVAAAAAWRMAMENQGGVP